MQTPEKRIYYLLDCFQSGTITPDEERELYEWIERTNNDEVLRHHVLDIYETIDEEAAPEADWDKLFNSIKKRSKISEPARVISIKKRTWSRIAAAAVLVALASFGYLSLKQNKDAYSAAAIQTPANDSTGKVSGQPLSGALLKSVSGSVVLQHSDTSFHLGGNTVRLSDGELSIDRDQVEQYTLSTPKGTTFKVVLDDGTKVWLNAASSISYPSVFRDKERTVSVSGEAFFEVAHDPAKPFIVQAGAHSIQVLGTSFNLQAYDDEPSIVTTLITGSLRVYASESSLLLKPNQQSQWSRTGSIRLTQNPDIGQAVAWRQGHFRFHQTELRTIMRQLARWYDLEVIFEAGWKTQYFGGVISKENKLSTVLDMLEATHDVAFRVEGNRVTVLPHR